MGNWDWELETKNREKHQEYIKEPYKGRICSEAHIMKPLLKWAGGKRWLAPIMQSIWEPFQHHRLVEPFTGGMAIALELNPKKALLNDVNVHLINFYQQVKLGLSLNPNSNPKSKSKSKSKFKFKPNSDSNSNLNFGVDCAAVLGSEHSSEHSQVLPAFQNKSDFYYKIRDNFNALIHNKKYQSKEAAWFFYYLMRTGYNGLCRFNNGGSFNVPFGQHKSIRYKTCFLEYQSVFKKWQLKALDFQKLSVKEEDFLYADPPYDVEFTKYSESDFTWSDQIRLAHWLNAHKGFVVASNQATPRVLELYQDLKFTVFTLKAPRSISCTGDRNPTLEILAFKNFEKKYLSKLSKQYNLTS